MDPPPALVTPLHPSSIGSFPILATSIVGILSTSVLLLSYYVFVIKCCLNPHHQHHPDVVAARFSRPRGAAAATADQLGLTESAIRAMPTFRYRARTAAAAGSSGECAVCLSEFREEERIKLLPDCLHLFHIDCIDTWLQCNANCPLCRARIAASFPHRHFPAPVPREAFDVTIEVRDPASGGLAQAAVASASAASSPWKTEQGGKARRHFSGRSRGDECIDGRTRDERFCVQQPMRRSFSMDSSGDRELYVALQEILQRSSLHQDAGGESSSSSRLRRSLFSFGRTRSSHSSVLPVQI